jgi:MoaA/NifB/PqqE/SkfB family radical SAM enzyme
MTGDGASIYDTRFIGDGHGSALGADDPLAFLRADTDSGWHVQRNLLKPLNHLPLLVDKDVMAQRLRLHSTSTPPAVFDANYDLLRAHQERRVSTDAVIAHLAADVGATVQSVREQLRSYVRVGHMEFHPTDVCNLTCQGCTYGHDDPDRKPPPINFPFEAVHRLADLRPRSMVVIGGGEPALYRSGRARFQELIDEIDAHLPDVRLALVSNGTFKPPGEWPDRFSWIRLSLDAATPETYANFRGKAMFQRVVDSFLAYLDHDIEYVGISFLYARPNVHEYARVAKLVYDLTMAHKPHALPKVNIQYRPLRRDPRDFDRPFDLAVSDQQIQAAVRELSASGSDRPEFERFLREQTNARAILGGNAHPPHDFDRCHYSQLFKIVRASGDLRPCFIRVTEPEFVLGNIITDPLETIALNTLYVGARRAPDCDAHGCRQCHVNHILGNGLRGTVQPSDSAAVRADPMF